MLRTLEGKGHETALSKTVVKDFRQTFYKSLAVEEERLPDLWPKKGKVISYKTKSGDDRKSEHIVVDGEHHFIHVEDYVVPSLKTVHAYTNMYPRFTCDAGAIKFILKGANVMSPGLTNENASMDNVEKGKIVAIYVKDHEHAVAIGVTTKSTEDIKTENEGVAVETIHFVGDGFWNMLYKK